jgi:diguanylate cyclase (GGDEF)-like protein/PAS domain S-box-containing protein
MLENRSNSTTRRFTPETAWSHIAQDSDSRSLALTGLHAQPGPAQDAAYPEIWLARRPAWQRFVILALIAAVYFAAGKAGLLLIRQNASVPLIWPATGIATAALLLFGQRAWPAIALGSCLLSFTTTHSIAASLGVAAGNTIEAYLGAWLTRRWANGWRAFERSQDILRFAFFAAFLATIISATFGVASLWLVGRVSLSNSLSLWSRWWLGAGVGAVILTPLIVLLATQPRPRWTARRWIEAMLLFSGLFVVSTILFGGFLVQIDGNYPLTFVCIPFLFWTSFRFGPREASITTLIIAALAIGGALHDTGRFSALPPDQSLILAQSFLGVIALTTLGVAASVTQSKRLEALASQLAAIVESSYDAIVGKSINGTILSWNEGAERLYGYTAAEAIGRSISILSPAGVADEIPEIMQRIRREESIEPYETVRRRKDGTLVDISLAISPVRDADGHVIAASAISRDITERKRTEAALVEANDKLKAWLNQLEQEAHEIVLLNQMSHLLQTSLTEEEIGAVVRQFAEKLFPGDSGAVCVRSASAELVERICAWGSQPPTEQVFSRQDCWALRHGQVHAVSNAHLDLICPHWMDGPWPANSLCVPMMAQGDSLGCLLLRRPALLPVEADAVETRSTISREQLAVTVAGHIALALANLRLRESLRLQSIRDALTGLYNRRYLNEVLEREVRRAARGQRHLAVVLLDVDGFKGLNDTYGHEAGDTFLRELGAYLQKRVREEDVACRYGGDEFVIILTETSLETARRRARQLREGIKTLAVPHRGRYLTPPTVSLGVALYPDHGASADELLRAADDALYRAKGRGRDCMVISNAGGEARERAS